MARKRSEQRAVNRADREVIEIVAANSARAAWRRAKELPEVVGQAVEPRRDDGFCAALSFGAGVFAALAFVAALCHAWGGVLSMLVLAAICGLCARRWR